MAKPETAAAGRKPAEKQGEEDPLVERDVRGPLTVLTMQYRPYNLVGTKLMGVLLAELAAPQRARSRGIVLVRSISNFNQKGGVQGKSASVRQECWVTHIAIQKK